MTIQLPFQPPDVLTVTQLSDHILQVIRHDELLDDLMVAGEVSNPVHARSGHLYFSLKDTSATINCVMWRSAVATLHQIPTEGQNVVARGRIDLYAPRGQLQLVVSALRPQGGIGDLYRQFEEIRDRLRGEGLFDAETKRHLPSLPRLIGVVTSDTGAALRDVMRVLSERWPLARVLLVPSLVQGAAAPAALQSALMQLYAQPGVDVIILARGGGSIEDLWAFNDEGLARLIRRSPVPVVCGVGHETDSTIADFVADVRAATPSAAAAAVVPDQDTMRQSLDGTASRLYEIMDQALNQRWQHLAQIATTLKHLSPQQRISQQRQRLSELQHRLTSAMSQDLNVQQLQLKGLHQQLNALSPNAVIQRGYAIVRNAAGNVVQSVQQVSPGDDLEVRVRDGSFPVIVSDGGSLDADGIPTE